ncbi:hypothetical protein CAOG_009575 [Capsaspora owczarzaki ATCC 30864]|uniref:Rho-GAP domain-containing protein n=1 Tax=Capsaspora owczarzaki (strain ATCC 30864) TaxID=595528 RepID=A0A0D2WMY3_CAPO3|nr:hypothetical protein CAOG_009575 [Capsaspora owczarzaki ATCC 30864]
MTHQDNGAATVDSTPTLVAVETRNGVPTSITDTGETIQDAVQKKMNMSPSQAELLRLRSSSSNKSDAAEFAFENFAKKFFVAQKAGIFRRKVSLAAMSRWTSAPIASTLTVIQLNPKHKNVVKDAINIFRLIQMVMGDRELRKFPTVPHVIQHILEKGLFLPEIRDEIFSQLCKQIAGNPHLESHVNGWVLLSVMVWMFPPSRNMENYLKHFVLMHYDDSEPRVNTLARYSFKKLMRVCETGARARVPTLPEIERARDAPFNPSVFGSTLDDIMSMQTGKMPDVKLPLVLTSLTESVLRLSGAKTEGIFRVPGDTDAVFALKLKIERADYAIASDDPHVPASLLKLWLRELDEPIIPTEFYPDCIKNAKEATQAIAIIDGLPQINRDVVRYLISFLKQIGEPGNQAVTKMSLDNLAMVFAPSFLRCPSENPQTIFENTRHEQDFTRTLLEHLN